VRTIKHVALSFGIAALLVTSIACYAKVLVPIPYILISVAVLTFCVACLLAVFADTDERDDLSREAGAAWAAVRGLPHEVWALLRRRSCR